MSSKFSTFSNRWPISDSSQKCSEPYDRKPGTAWQHCSVFEHWRLSFPVFCSWQAHSTISRGAILLLLADAASSASCQFSCALSTCETCGVSVGSTRMLAGHVADEDVLYHLACTCGPVVLLNWNVMLKCSLCHSGATITNFKRQLS